MLLLYLLEFYLLTMLYATYLAPVWQGSGFEMIVNERKIAVAIALISAFSLATPTRSSVRAFYLNFLLSTHFVPAMVLFCYADKPYAAAGVYVGAYAILYVVSAIPVQRVAVANVRTSSLLAVLAAVTVCIVLSYPSIAGYGTFNLSLAAVYDFRREAAEALPGLFGYISPLVTNVMIPVCTAIAVANRRYGMVLCFIIIAILQFGFTSHKSPLFAPFIVIVVYYLLFRYGRYSAVLFGLVVALVLGLADTLMLAWFGDGSIWGWYNTLLVRRAIMTPALLDYMYIDFFSQNVKYYWSSSRISIGSFPVPYDGMRMPFLIGEVYFGAPDMSANTGFVGTGYGQAGIFGVVLYACGIGTIISLLESHGKYLGVPFTVASTIIIASSFRATDLLTLLTTHGLAVLLLLLMVVRFDERSRVKLEPTGSQRARRMADG